MNDVAQETSTWQARLARHDPELRVHLIGIGGAGLSAIAQVLLEMGIQVSGSDRQASAATEQLAAAGALVHRGQQAENITGQSSRPDVVLISSAVDSANPERAAAEALGVAVVKRDGLSPWPVPTARPRPRP
jgi:UDP-N-acetylmuramate--alanine ligase